MKLYYLSTILFLSALIISGCKLEKTPEVEVEEEITLDATYVHFGDSNEYLIGVDTLLIEEICFYPNYCTFIYDSVGYSGKYNVKHQDIWIAGSDDMDSLHLLMISEDELRGEGMIVGRFLKKGSPAYFKAMQEVNDYLSKDSTIVHEQTIDKENLSSTPNTVNSSTTSSQSNTSNPNNSTTTTNTSNNSNTSDPRLSGAKKAIITYGKNLSGNTFRVRMSEPKTHSIYTNEKDASIYLMLTVDAKGNVLKSINNENKTTTDNSKLINDIIDLSKQIKYNKEPGVNLVKIPITIYVKTE